MLTLRASSVGWAKRGVRQHQFSRRHLPIMLLLLSFSIALASCGGGSGGGSGSGASNGADNTGGDTQPNGFNTDDVVFADFGNFLTNNPGWNSGGQLGLSLGNSDDNDVKVLELGAGTQDDQLKISVTEIESQQLPTAIDKTLTHKFAEQHLFEHPTTKKRISSLELLDGTTTWGNGLYYSDSLLALVSEKSINHPTSTIDGLLMVTGNELVWSQAEQTTEREFSFGGPGKTFAQGYHNPGYSYPFEDQGTIQKHDAVMFAMKLEIKQIDTGGNTYRGTLAITDWQLNSKTPNGQDDLNAETYDYLPKPAVINFNANGNMEIVSGTAPYIGLNYFSFTESGIQYSNNNVHNTHPIFKFTSTVTARMYGSTLDDSVIAGIYVFTPNGIVSSALTQNPHSTLSGLETAYWGVYVLTK